MNPREQPSRPDSPGPPTRSAAWQRYLEATRDVHDERYDEVEAAAWAQLVAALDQLGDPRPRR